MTPYVSRPEDLVLHGPRVLGFAGADRIAARYHLDVAEVEETLLDFEAHGWVRHSEFAGSAGWSITDAGRDENERRLARELDHVGARVAIAEAHADFLPLNRRFTAACTKWQIRPARHDPSAFNDHTDWAWDERVFRTLTSLERSLVRLCEQLTEHLSRLDGYADRYSAALVRVNGGQRAWIDSPELDSLHTVWIQLHEDLLATLGIPRGTDS